MDSARIARLTEQQRICLRHVYAHLTSKEIAPLMGIEPNSVDQHIKAAMRVLDVPDRRSAARMLAEHEQRAEFRPLVYQSPDVAMAPDPVTFVPSNESGRHSGFAGQAIRENQAAFVAAAPARIPSLPFPIGGARPNDVGWATRLVWIASIAIGIALAFGALVAGVETLTRLIRG
jgi:DNA-binding CsgD family transcriptional regulator